MQEVDILYNYRLHRCNLINLNDEDIVKLRRTVAYSSLDALRKQATKSIRFLTMKLMIMDPTQKGILEEIMRYSLAVQGGKDEQRSHKAILSYLSNYGKKRKNMYEKVLYAALYEYISGLYFEHRFINALLIELSSLFYTLKSEKEIIASYPSMKTSILLSIEKINSSLEEMLISCNECHKRPNTELLRLFSAGRSERKLGKCKDLNKEKEREIIRALKCRKAELELDRCQRSHTSLVREEIKDLNNRLFSISREHRRRYFSSLFYYLRKLLISEREGYESLFQRIADCYEKLNDGTASKRKLRTTISPLLSLARKGGRKELMKAKLIYPMLIRTIEPDVIESDIRLLFDLSFNTKEKAAEILETEIRRIDETRKVEACHFP